MKKLLQRIGAILLCMCMLMPMVPEIALAEEPCIVENIELPNLPAGNVGEVATVYTEYTSECEAIGQWEKYDYTQKQYVSMNITEQFEQGEIYRLVLSIETRDGYEFNVDNDWVLINGEQMYPTSSFGSRNINHEIYVNHAEEIDTIEISSANLPKAEIGKTFSNTAIDVPVAEGSPYIVSGKWYYMDEIGNKYYEGTFEKGKEYYFEFCVVPLTGYSLTDDTFLLLDGEDVWRRLSDYTAMYHSERASLKTVIDQVTLLNLPTATIGSSVTTGAFPVEVPADAPYTAIAEWCKMRDDRSWESVTSSTFEDNNRYKIMVTIEPKDGYELAEKVVINAYGVDHMVEGDFSITWYEREFLFLTEIPSVEITGYVEPKVGDDAVANAAALKVPADVNYEIVMAAWWELTPEGAEEVTTFEKGKDYALDIWVAPKSGYEFTRNTTVTVNGNKVDTNLREIDLCATEYVSFKEVITEVQVSNVPTVEIGKKVATDVKVPDGAKYDAIVMWRVWDDAKRDYVAFDGVFETGKAYELGVIVYPKDGYRFSEDETIFKIDGNEVEASDTRSDILIYNKGYQTEHKIIDRIELKIEEPVVGNHSSIAPVITIVGDANFSVIDDEDKIWWFIGTVDESATMDREYFVADENYGVYFMIQANEGYVFSDDLVIVINGKVIPKDAYTSTLKLTDIAYFFGMGTEEKIITAPQTGDESQIGLWVMFFMVGIFACSYALVERKRR